LVKGWDLVEFYQLVLPLYGEAIFDHPTFVCI
jgi:hypothetical protein